jgi:hypothetical protein
MTPHFEKRGFPTMDCRVFSIMKLTTAPLSIAGLPGSKRSVSASGSHGVLYLATVGIMPTNVDLRLQWYSVRGRRSALCFSRMTHFDLIGFHVLQCIMKRPSLRKALCTRGVTGMESSRDSSH